MIRKITILGDDQFSLFPIIHLFISLFNSVKYNYSMSVYSIRQNKRKRQQSQNLPQIDKNLCKSKKYYYGQNNKQNALKEDIDSYIHHLVNPDSNSCFEKLQKNQQRYINNKIYQSASKFAVNLEHLPEKNALSQEIKLIKNELNKYLFKMRKANLNIKGNYVQFIRLSQESSDYLEYYLKNHSKCEEDLSILHHSDKHIILSILKNNFKCIAENPPEIANRILLGLCINPLNDFHFIDWPVFSLFRKLVVGAHRKIEGRNFLINYYLVNNKRITKSEFWAITRAILGKFQKVMNRGNIERLVERIERCGASFIQDDITKEKLHHIIITEHLFIWQQLLELIFMI